MNKAERSELKWLEDQENIANELQNERLQSQRPKMSEKMKDIITKNYRLVDEGKISKESADLFIFTDCLLSGEIKFFGDSVVIERKKKKVHNLKITQNPYSITDDCLRMEFTIGVEEFNFHYTALQSIHVRSELQKLLSSVFEYGSAFKKGEDLNIENGQRNELVRSLLGVCKKESSRT